MKSLLGSMALVTAVSLAAPAAFAQEDAATAALRKQIEDGCMKAADGMFRKPQVAVDIKGSATFGLALVYGRSKEGKARSAAICVLDKKTGAVEIGTELASDLVRVRKGKPEGDKKNKDDSDDDE